jgi:preprotein translocase subunit YajC
MGLVAQAQPGGGLVALVPLLLVVVVFYLLVVLPMQRRQRRLAEMQRNLKTGDKVITTGGVLGTVVGFEGDVVQLRVADQVKIRVLRSAVAGLQPESREG